MLQNCNDPIMVTKAVSTSRQEPHVGLLAGTTTPHGTYLVKDLKRYASLIKAGVQVGDEIVVFGPFKGGELEAKMADVTAYVATVGVGGTVQTKVKRDGKILDIAVKLVAKKNLDLTMDDVDLALERKIAP
jgi:predicted metalloprotease with PDZ domain